MLKEINIIEVLIDESNKYESVLAINKYQVLIASNKGLKQQVQNIHRNIFEVLIVNSKYKMLTVRNKYKVKIESEK